MKNLVIPMVIAIRTKHNQTINTFNKSGNKFNPRLSVKVEKKPKFIQKKILKMKMYLQKFASDIIS